MRPQITVLRYGFGKPERLGEVLMWIKAKLRSLRVCSSSNTLRVWFDIWLYLKLAYCVFARGLRIWEQKFM